VATYHLCETLAAIKGRGGGFRRSGADIGMTPHLPCPEPSLSHCDHDDDSEVEVLQVGFRGVSLLGMSGLLEGSPGGTRLLQFATALSPGQNAVLRAGFCSVSGHVGAFNWVVRACR